MQKNDMALKRKLLIDGEEIPGLVETTALKDEEGVVEVPSFNRKIPIKDGVKMFDPIDCVYKVARDTKTSKFFHDWFTKNEYHDVTAINTDATGTEVDKYLLRDCECKKYDARAYNAGSIEFFGIGVTLICTSTPVRLTA
jgi:hypothetical protein